jgi:hypothetical protein
MFDRTLMKFSITDEHSSAQTQTGGSAEALQWKATAVIDEGDAREPEKLQAKVRGRDKAVASLGTLVRKFLKDLGLHLPGRQTRDAAPAIPSACPLG